MLVNENLNLKIRKQGLDLIEVICRCRKDLVRGKGSYYKIVQEILTFASVEYDDELKMDMMDYSMGILDSISNNCDIASF